MAPKGKKMQLVDFLADSTTGKVDWADDLDDFPSAPLPKSTIPRRGDDWLSQVPDRADRDSRGGPGGPGASGGFRDSYPPREELPLPTAPPYTAFIGNLSFEANDADVADFFLPSKCTSVRLVNGPDGRPKGFGYVEFETLDGLKDGLSRSGSGFNGRNIRVSVAEPRDAKGPGFNSVAEEASQWRRSGPLPPSNDGPGRRGPGGGGMGGDRPGFGRFESSGGGFDNMEVGPGGRAGFGSRFAAAGPAAGGPPREPRHAEPLEPSQGDNASDWRTGKPVEASALSPSAGRRPSAGPPGADANGRTPSFRRHGDATEVDEKYASQERLGFGSKFAVTPPESPSMQKKPGFGFDRRANPAGTPSAVGDGAETWRSARRASDQKMPQLASPNGEPAQRKKLELKARSTPVGGEASGAAASATDGASSKGSNPFGNAKPVDASEREREIEAKMAQREKERKEEERQRREKAKADKAPDNAPTGPKAERSRGQSRGEKGAATSSGAPSSARSSPAPADKQAAAVAAPSNGDANASGPTSPTAVTAAKAAPKQPPPTGAWGGGRKPSGALATAEELEAKQKQEDAVKGEKASDVAVVEETAKGVDAVAIDA